MAGVVPVMAARVRWLVGGGAVVASVALVAVAVVALGSRPTPEAMTYVPGDSDVVAELRPDLPGDQLSRVGNLLAHFPGYKDQSILAQKIDETLAKLTTSATNGKVDYPKQVKPWLAGPLFAGARAAPSGAGATSDFVAVFTTDGTVGCDQVMNGSTKAESYRGLDIHEPSSGDSAAPSCAIDGRQALVGSLAFVKAALDAHADHQGIDTASDYRTARDRLGGDRLATAYVARREMAAAGLPSGLASALPTIQPGLADALAALPAWVMVGVRAEDNALVADIVSAPFNAAAAIPGASLAAGASPAPGASLLTAPPAHASQLAPLLPADTAALFEVHGGGVAVQNLLTEVRTMPGIGTSLARVDAAIGSLGGAPSLFGWIGDAGIAVIPDGTSATGGLVLLAPDEATATARASQLVGLIKLSGLFGGTSVTVTETTIDGATVTLADFGEVSSLVGGTGGLSGIGGIQVPPGTHLVISIATHGSAVLVGNGESFPRHVLETASGASLADQASYRTALGLAATTNSGQLYLAAAPLLALAESSMAASDRARYESDVKPYLASLDAFLETTTVDASGLRARLVLTVR